MNIDFDNSWRLVSYANGSRSGSFESAVINDLTLNKNHSDDVFGGIRNAVFTPTFEVGTAAVTEPASMILLGSGVVGVGATLRRKRRDLGRR